MTHDAETAERPNLAVLGLFEEPDAAARAVARLRAAGFAGREIEVLTDAPYPERAFGEEPSQHRLHLFTLAGAVIGLALGLLLTIGTQLSYPVVTGGMPILAIPPMLTITFEATMLGAIVLTVAGILFESRLPHLGHGLYDPRIAEGYLGVLVAPANGQADAAAHVLQDVGAHDIIVGAAGAAPVR
ncbi:MAG: quinol:electron acceptor oxidoreductase subunit ActD [Chloroflexota bacterium]